jgi:ribonuclease VapC
LTGQARSGFILDASALLAYFHEESGGASVRTHIAGSQMSALNWSEVLQKTLARGVDIEGLLDEITDMGLAIIPFTAEDAATAAFLWRGVARSLSLADRACLALSARLGLPALTADRAWRDLDVGVEVRLIR